MDAGIILLQVSLAIDSLTQKKELLLPILVIIIYFFIFIFCCFRLRDWIISRAVEQMF